MSLIKLIWDFRGPNAEHTAQHHLVHLEEYLQLKKIEYTTIGTQEQSKMWFSSYLVLNKEYLEQLRAELKPNRGTHYTPKS